MYTMNSCVQYRTALVYRLCGLGSGWNCTVRAVHRTNGVCTNTMGSSTLLQLRLTNYIQMIKSYDYHNYFYYYYNYQYTIIIIIIINIFTFNINIIGFYYYYSFNPISPKLIICLRLAKKVNVIIIDQGPAATVWGFTWSKTSTRCGLEVAAVPPSFSGRWKCHLAATNVKNRTEDSNIV